MSSDNENTVLIVDDNPENLSVLSDYLQKAQFKVLVAEKGESALKRLKHIKPDIILLDVIMPGINGFETCRQLKKDPQFQEIPVIFLTALSDTIDKVEDFKVGAINYITKPFKQEEVLVRLKTHLTISRLQKELQAKNDQLTILNQEKNEFLGIAAHDLKNPLSAIQGLINLIESRYDQMSKEQVMEMLRMVSNSSKKMFALIKNLLDVNAIESGKKNILLQTIDILPTVQSLVRHYSDKAIAKNITVQLQSQEKPYTAFVDENSLYQVLDNLISNAIKYSPHGKNITVRMSEDEQQVRCEIQDDGPGLSESDQQKLFGKFTRLTAQPTGGESSTGLGLFIVKKLVEAMNGKVWCESELGHGATFIVEFQSAS